jgi:hypothetical protein
VLQLFLDGVARNLALLGAARPADLDLGFVRAPEAWFVPTQTQHFEAEAQEAAGVFP